ncbi:jg12965 [Pararge aegeria aegeria]|uniref:Jg12965 protein n=1 Tax=Pararge aegeria aegeria TaxID=348720 RepID=A0A8S4RVU7_9NEOP|nr:jg12965 [Pararge aegeria aegeria]
MGTIILARCHMGRGRGSSGRPGCSVGRAAGCHRRVRRRLLNERAAGERRRRHARSALQAATEEGRPGRARPPRTPARPAAMCPNKSEQRVVGEGKLLLSSFCATKFPRVFL